jgi:hypothetical protein
MFTGLLSLFYYAYSSAAKSFYDLVSEMENILFDVDFRPMKAYNEIHRKKYGFLNSITLVVPFVLSGSLFLLLLILSLIK